MGGRREGRNLSLLETLSAAECPLWIQTGFCPSPATGDPNPGLCSQTTGQPLQRTKSTQPLTPLRTNTSHCVLMTKSHQQGLLSELRLVLYGTHCDPLNTSFPKSAICLGTPGYPGGSPRGPIESLCVWIPDFCVAESDHLQPSTSPPAPSHSACLPTHSRKKQGFILLSGSFQHDSR